ncbi:phosphoenolpyruvate-protein phosphotransferase [Leptolyngbya sp. Heron Island J]|uniref:phosphoenolpyruvate--protein phosphotransferase n=1 Tax=Leptolyngbya sp. Heron Island J TaxID=1385935 RepID=UPI0003B9F561|nr:phosphoenolpyruvate--protein phosphotransferase [Leptolyngbya sp. Heron Island J]ESA33134.1 phosphoenolpyruvate-protein phosphotransferase [Leptolyngbya sp. Heron Island J]
MALDTRSQVQTTLRLTAPLSGYLMPLESVPDPVFAQKMVGDGISVDPISNILRAPCDGEIIQIHPSHHAVTLKTTEGIEILMHVGLDTVELRGEGFSPQVNLGDRVTSGDALLEFDIDYVALHAKSLLTQIIITNTERIAGFVFQQGLVNAGQDIVLELVLAADQSPLAVATGEKVTSEPIIIGNPQGLHARPAAVLVNLAKQYQSQVSLVRGSVRANGKSVVAIMAMQVAHGDSVTLEATGSDAKGAITELTEAVRSGLGEAGAAPAPASIDQSALKAPPPQPKSDDPNIILGVAASSGLTVGNTYRVREQTLVIEEVGESPGKERRKLEDAIAKAALEIESIRAKVHGQGNPGKAAIFAAHQEILDDPELMDIATSAINKGKSANFAWKQTYTTQADQLAQLNNELLAERANDIRDVGMRVLRILTGVEATEIKYPHNTILLAEDLTPSDMANLDRERVVGFCTLAGGATSHVAILARSMGIPAIAGAEPRVLDLADGTPVILDGTKGTLRLNAPADEIERTRTHIANQKAKQAADLKNAFEPAITQDGHPVEIVANIGGLQDAEEAVSLGTEGVGLLRTEFIFMERPQAPTEDEQTGIYRSIAEVLGPDKPMIIRTLDVGGDKPLPYLTMAPEENPFLGERGIRLGFDQPELQRTQLRAILRSASAGKLRVMFPMIGRIEELRMAKAMLEEERQALNLPPVEVGIMIEVPAAAVMAEQFAKEVDFFSVGTNDLTQYTLAMDRGHPKLAPFVDGLHPAVLRLIGHAVKGAGLHDKWVGVCGGIGSDPQAIPLLIGLGVKELSVSVSMIPSIKAQVRSLKLSHCKKLAAQALGLETAAEVRSLVPLPDL